MACFGSKCVGVCRNLMSPTFLDVFLDVESDKKNRLKFWPSGAEKSPFFWFWPHTGQFYLVNFSKNEKIFQKSMFYGLFCSKFCTDHFSAVHFGLSGPTYAKNSKNCRKHPFDTLGTSFNQSGATIRGRKMQLSRRLMGGQGRRIFWWYFQLAPMTHSPWVMSHENGAGHFRSLPVFSFRSILFQILSGSFFTKRFGSIWYHLRII